MIGGVLVEKDLETVKKDLDTQIINVIIYIKIEIYVFLFRLNKLWKWYIEL